MWSEHRCNDIARGFAAAACGLLLFFTACGGGGRDVACGDRVCDPAETATDCP